MNWHLAVLAWKRPAILERTLLSFCRHNRLRDWRLWYALDGGSDESQCEMLAAMRFQCLVQQDENVGIARMFDDLLGALMESASPEDLVLILEDDWESIRPVPVFLIEDFLRNRTTATYRLFGRYKERGRGGSLRLCVEDRQLTQWQTVDVAGQAIETAQSFWCHPPQVTRLALAYEFAHGAVKEPVSIARSLEAGVWVGWQPDRPCFYHIGHPGRRELGGKR
jgi:hypothetical protein